MKNLTCREIAIDENHNIMILYRNGQYDCYIMEHDEYGETPYIFMFGMPCKQAKSEFRVTFEGIVDIVTSVAEEYFDLCD